MKKTTYRGLSVLVLACALLALLPAAPARASSSTHMITWLSGSSSTVISPDKMVMTTTPTQNYLSEHVFNLNFSFTGNAAKGDVKIRLPAQIFVDRNGQSYGSVTVPLLLAPNKPTFGNRFSYYIDTATNEVVITNTEPINGDFFLSVDIKYSGIKPDQIPMTFDEANNEYVYTKLFKAIMDVTTTDGNVESYTSNDLTMRYKTRADLNSLGKYLYGTYASWPGNLYGLGTPAPGSNPNDYFYVAWDVYASAATNDTMPFDLSLREINPPGDEYGELIGFSTYQTSGWRQGGLDAFRSLFNPYSPTITQPRVSNTNNATRWRPYVLFRYPKTLLVDNKATVKNIVEGEVKGLDGMSNILTAQTSVPFAMPTPPPVNVPGDQATAYKSNSGTSYGLINRIEDNKKAPWTLVRSLPTANQVYGNFYTSSQSFSGWAASYDGTEYGKRDYTYEFTDERLGYWGGSPYMFRPFTDGDYQLTKLRFGTWTEYGPNITSTSYSTVQRPADQHRPITLLYEVGGVWSTLGTVEKYLEGTLTRYRYTPSGGTPIVYTSAIDIPLPAGTTGVRFRHVTNAVYVSYNAVYVETELLRSQAVLDAIRGLNTQYIYDYVDIRVTDADGKVYTTSPGASHALTRITPVSYASKTRTEPVEDIEGQRYYVDYTSTMYDLTTNPGDMNRASLISEGILMEQRQSTFYDLLPPGTMVDLNTITVTGYGLLAGSPTFSHRVELHDNWRGSGRTMLIVHAQAPDGLENYYYYGAGAYNYLGSGMVLKFRMYNTWSNVVDNGSTLVNAIAYESHDGTLGTGYADAPSTDIPYALRAYMNDLNQDGNPVDRLRNFLYANVSLTYTPLRAFETGFSKSVASPEDPVFDEHTEVMPGGSYTYRLRLNNPLVRVKDLVYYDVLEEAYGSNPYWKGTLVGVDVSHALNKGINAKVYYATTPVTDAQIMNDPDRRHLDNNLGTIWSLTPPADLSTVTAVAIDLRTRTNGSEYIANREESVLVNINM